MAASFCGCKHLKVAEGTYPGCVFFNWSGIEKISGLILTGTGQKRIAASFHACKQLKVAEGTYPGCVAFSWSGIETIGALKITELNGATNIAALFNGCWNLKVARGDFPGFVSFRESGIEKIERLSISKTAISSLAGSTGKKADFRGCKNLTKIPLIFSTKEILADDELLEQFRKATLRKFLQKGETLEL